MSREARRTMIQNATSRMDDDSMTPSQFRRRGTRARRVLLPIALMAALAACEPRPPQTDTAPVVTVPQRISATAGPISLTRFAELLSAADEAILAQGLEVDIAEQTSLAAAGAFEPEVYATLTRSGELSQTSASEYLSQGSGASSSGNPLPYSEYESSGRVGLEMLTRTGVTVDLFYEMSAVSNSLQATANRPTPEYFAAAGIEVRAPLLRNAGREVNTSNEVVAGIDKTIAEETVRLVTSQRLFDGLSAYLMVQRAHEQLRWRQRVAKLAADLQTEMDRQVSQGLRSQTELIEATARRVQRDSEVTLAQRELAERIGAFQIYFSGIDSGTEAARWQPSDVLAPVPYRYQKRSSYGSLDQAFANRPEARINALRLEREEVLRMVAENRAKPQADLVLDYRRTQLDGDYIPFRDVFSKSNPYDTWRVGFEFRRGLKGDETAKAELRSAELREAQADLAMNAFRQRVASELNGISSILARARESLAQQDRMIAAQQELLTAERTAFDNGRSSELEVLSRRINLAQAQEARADAVVQLNLATFLASQVDGTLLERFGLAD